jgi:hypothetical protein
MQIASKTVFVLSIHPTDPMKSAQDIARMNNVPTIIGTASSLLIRYHFIGFNLSLISPPI